MARVAFVTTSYPSFAGDPAGHFVELEARTRAVRGDDVVVLAPGARPSQKTGVTVVALPGAPAFGWPGALERLRERPYRALSAGAFVLAARRTLRELGDLDDIVAHWLLPSAFPIACAGRGLLEVVLHGSDVRLFARLPLPAREAIVERLLARAARFRFVSKALRDQFAHATTPRVLERSSVSPCAIDVSGAPTRLRARQWLGIGPRETVAVMAGRLVPGKRPEAAIRLALERNPDRVVVVGDGPLRGVVRRLDPRVVTVGVKTRDDTLAWISAADYVVSASRLEGAPTVIREARALGVKVIAVACGDVEEWARTDAGIELVTERARDDASVTL